jgi:DNA-directed RNA polymerase specialized sigma24 family protein
MGDSKVDTHFTNDCETDFAEGVRVNQEELIFNVRFWRSYRTLHYIACRVLGGPERAEEAIGNCWSIASCHPQRLADEGEFRSWLLRVLIDEALVLLRESVPRPTLKALCEPVPAHEVRGNGVSDGKGDIRTDDQDRFSPDFSMALE